MSVHFNGLNKLLSVALFTFQVIDPAGFLHWTRKLFGSITPNHPPVFDNGHSRFVTSICKALEGSLRFTLV